MLKLLSLAAAARQLGVCPATAKKILGQIPDVQVQASGRTLFRQDALTAYVQHGGASRPVSHADQQI